jgi:hypothetical protein
MLCPHQLAGTSASFHNGIAPGELLTYPFDDIRLDVCFGGKHSSTFLLTTKDALSSDLLAEVFAAM